MPLMPVITITGNPGLRGGKKENQLNSHENALFAQNPALELQSNLCTPRIKEKVWCKGNVPKFYPPDHLGLLTDYNHCS